MRIGLVVDGQAEFAALPALLPRVKTDHQILRPLFADIQPWAAPELIARRVEPKLRMLGEDGVEVAVVLSDFESKPGCPGRWASDVERLLTTRCSRYGVEQVKVVAKVRTFENWLVADLAAFGRMRRRFKVTNAQRRTVSPDAADRCDAKRAIRAMVQGIAYDKIEDSKRILAVADPLRIAANSRSFRRFLRLLGSAPYADQSRRP